ncbi:Outer membrane protein TolC [Flavobacterium defluvii]|uniref:Outer membrane protein TolC n=2 Tax=Flavobacterium defluvii TaxID=370979 RepID=A0A1M5IK79_9FLAO|nr:Outer membrane protein TolC [Flavobacterium defluvii]
MKTQYKINIKPFANFAKNLCFRWLSGLRLSTFLLAGTMLSAQSKISLEKAIELAKSSNIDLKIADKEIEKQILLKKTAFQPDPLQVQYQGGQFNSVDFDHNVSVQQFFPLGNVTKANRQLQEELAKLAEKRKALSSYELEKAVTLAYYQYLYGISIQKLNSELNEIYTKFLKNAELRFKTGESGNIEVISAKAKVKEIETQKEQLNYDLAIYQKQLQFFVQTDENIIPDETTSLQYPFIENKDSKAESLMTDFYQQQISVYQKEAGTFKANRTPKLGLGYFAQTINTESLFQGFTAGLQIPLFGGVNTAKAKAAQISISQSQLALDKNKIIMNLQKEELQNNFQKQQKNLNYYQNEGLQYANQIIETAQKSYANGDMSYWSYISFLNQAIDIKKQLAEATHSFNQSAIELQFPTIKNN